MRRGALCGTVLAAVFAAIPVFAAEVPAAAGEVPAASPGAPTAAVEPRRTAEPAPAIDDWRSLPVFGADVRSLVVHPGDPDLVLAGTSAGQLYRSDDGGTTWRAAGPPAALAGWVVSKLVFDPDRPGRLWAALWGVWGGGSVLVSDDLGATWTPRAEGLPGQVYALARVPGTADRAAENGAELAGAGKLYAGTRAGVWGSDDGGGSWRRLTAALPEMKKVTSLLVDPQQPGAVLAGSWRRAYRSDDGGATWHGVFEGMALDSEVFTLEPAPDRPGEIWASTCGWVYRSLDSGRSWRKFKEGLAWRRTPSFSVLPGGRLLAGTVGGLYTSEDGGASWRRRGIERLPVLALAYHPRRPNRVLVGTEGAGVWISDDGGTTLRRSDTGMTNLHVGALTAGAGGVLAAVNHAGPGSGVYRIAGADRTVQPPAQPLPTVLSLAVSGPTVLAATEEGLWERSAGEWRQVAEVAGRVEQVMTSAGRVIARTAGGVWERAGAGARFFPLSGSDPRAGRGAELAEAADWPGLEADAVHPTGDRLRPAVVRSGEVAALVRAVDGGSGHHTVPLELDFPAREITAAAVSGGWLYLGTSGWGLWAAPLAE